MCIEKKIAVVYAYVDVLVIKKLCYQNVLQNYDDNEENCV